MHSIDQNGHSLEIYVEDFIQYCHLVTWNGQVLMDLFWVGLDLHLVPLIPPGNPTLTLRLYLDWVLWLSGSSLTVAKVVEDAISTQSLSVQSTSAILASEVLSIEPPNATEFLPSPSPFFTPHANTSIKSPFVQRSLCRGFLS